MCILQMQDKKKNVFASQLCIVERHGIFYIDNSRTGIIWCQDKFCWIIII